MLDLAEFTGIVRSKLLEAGSSEEAASVFKLIDNGQAGRITPDTLSAFLVATTGVKPTEVQLNEMMKFADRDGDGMVGVNDWKAVIVAGRRRQRKHL